MTTNPVTPHELEQEINRLRNDNQDLGEELYRLRVAIHALVSLNNKLITFEAQTDTSAILSQILSAALDAVDSVNGSLLLLDEKTNELVFVEVQGPQGDSLLGYRMPLKQGIAGWAVSNQLPILVGDARSEPRFSPLVDETIGFQTISLIAVPLVYGEKALGVIEVVNSRSGEPFREEDMDFLSLVALPASMALALANQAKEAEPAEENSAEY